MKNWKKQEETKENKEDISRYKQYAKLTIKLAPLENQTITVPNTG